MYLFQFYPSFSRKNVCSMSFLLQLRCFCYRFVCIMYFSLKSTRIEWRFQSDRQYSLIELRGVCTNKCLLTVNNKKTIKLVQYFCIICLHLILCKCTRVSFIMYFCNSVARWLLRTKLQMQISKCEELWICGCKQLQQQHNCNDNSLLFVSMQWVNAMMTILMNCNAIYHVGIWNRVCLLRQ